MDCPIKVSSTDEEEDIDIEGDDDELPCQVTVNTDRAEIKGEVTKSTSHPPDIPFRRQTVPKTHRNESECSLGDDFTKWWKSAGEFQRTVPNSNDSNEKESVKVSSDINPILQAPETKDQETFHPVEDKIYDDNGELFQPPEKEITISPSDVSEEERQKFPEFFSGRTRYSPHNYITIRNTILRLWNENKPNHVNKVILRPILRKTSGNVNNIGKIHRYLESMGAINFGSDAVWWKRRRRYIPVYRAPKTPLDTDYKLKRALEQRMSGRSRKRPAPLVSELPLNSSIGGYTIDHANNNAIHVTKRVREKNTKLQSKKYSLLKCREFSASEECPYDVTIDASALVVMDVHSHLSTHEVMGLIGGFLSDCGNGKIKVHIKCAQPCKSSASLRHCEMDPVSQSSACEHISLRGMKVLGWYHSHPTFPPHPSETDITTQMEQQSMFAAHDSVFLGVILTPYYKHQLKTGVNLVHVQNGGIPFTVPYQIKSEPPDVGSLEYEDLIAALGTVIAASAEICGKGGSSTSRLSHLLDPVVQASSVTHLDKLVRSLSSYVNTTKVPSQFDDKIIRQPLSSGEEYFDDVTSDSGLMVPMAISSCEIVTSSLHSDDDTSESYSIDQNFPSLADNGLVCQEDDDVIADVTPPTSESPQFFRESPATSIQVFDSWCGIFNELKSMLLKASENILEI